VVCGPSGALKNAFFLREQSREFVKAIDKQGARNDTGILGK
jgi:hypothetical protein